MKKRILSQIAISITCFILTACSSMSLPNVFPSSSSSSTANYEGQSNVWAGSPAQVWEKIQRTSSANLASMQASTQDPTKLGWIQLARIVKQKNLGSSQFAAQLINWREQHPGHPANSLLPSNSSLMQLQSSPPPRQIAVLLPQNGTYGSSGQAVKQGILNAYYANQMKIGKQNIKFYDTTQASMPNLYQQALAEGADIVIGPLVKDNVAQLSRSGSFSRPTLALNYTDGSLPSNFYEFGLLPEDEVSQVAARARQSGLSHALLIAPQTAWGQRMASTFSAQWQALGGSIQDTWLYPSSPTRFNEEIARLLHVNPHADKKLMEQDNNKSVLAQQRRQDFDVIILFAQAQNARVIVPLLRYYYVTNVPIYTTSSVYTGKSNPVSDVDLNGVTVCDIPHAGNTNRLYAVGQDAYLLSQSLDRLMTLANFPIYGATGALVLSPQHKIHRRLPCVTIHV